MLAAEASAAGRDPPYAWQIDSDCSNMINYGTLLVHDFLIPDLGRVSPYGVYDIAQNEAWVSVGTDHDTAAFAVESIRRWWRGMGQALYPSATRLLITADAGGSNGYRLRLWKLELQKLADETGLEIDVCHLPPGTSKWNKIEHRLFSAISQNWRGKPLVSHEVVVNLIGATTPRTGLRVQSQLDTRPGAPYRTTNSKPSICVETLSMVNGIIRCYPALRCSIELIIS